MGRLAHVPGLVGVVPLRYSRVLHVGWGLHVYCLMTPLISRYCLSVHTGFGAHAPGLVAVAPCR